MPGAWRRRSRGEPGVVRLLHAAHLCELTADVRRGLAHRESPDAEVVTARVRTPGRIGLAGRAIERGEPRDRQAIPDGHLVGAALLPRTVSDGVEVPADEHGLSVVDGDRLCGARRVRLPYLAPDV